MLSIAVIGAMCSGKTTLVKSYMNDGRVQCVPDLARSYLIKHPNVDRTSLITCQQIIQEYRDAFKTPPKDKVLISDGCSLTPIAHLVAYSKQNEADQLLEAALEEIRKVDLYIILDTNDVDFVNDEIRTETVEFREALQRAFLHLANELELNYYLISGSLADRRAKIDSLINFLPSN